MAINRELYNDKVKRHFLHPKNIGIIKNASRIGTAGNPEDGDIIRLYVDIKLGIIANAKVQVFGCPVAIATASILTEMIKGKTIEDVLKIKNQDVSKALGGLPTKKLNCSVLAEQLIRNTLVNEKVID
jgi:nitrogen fixation NifU-like protein